MTSYDLIRLLSDGRWHSGAAIGDAFGVGRAAVWKQIEAVRAFGLVVDADRGKGYRLVDKIQLCDGVKIKELLGAAAIVKVESLTSTNSTNTQLMQRLQQKDCTLPYAIFADHQTAGKGRRGRSWVSPLGRSLYFSLGWRFDMGLAELSGLSQVVAVAIRAVLVNYGFPQVKLKWPNDLIAEDCKLAGVLIELQGEASGPCEAVIGVGLNISLSEHLSVVESEQTAQTNQAELDGITQPWTDLCQLSINEASWQFDKNQFAADMLTELVGALQTFQQKGFAAFTEDWREADYLANTEISVNHGSQTFDAIYRGIKFDGSIMVESANGLQTLNGGEISVRRATVD